MQVDHTHERDGLHRFEVALLNDSDRAVTLVYGACREAFVRIHSGSDIDGDVVWHQRERGIVDPVTGEALPCPAILLQSDVDPGVWLRGVRAYRPQVDLRELRRASVPAGSYFVSLEVDLRIEGLPREAVAVPLGVVEFAVPD